MGTEKKKSAHRRGATRFTAGAPAVGRKLWLGVLISAGVAAFTYALTLSGYLFPGESATLFTQWFGVDALTLPVSPIWGGIVKSLAAGSFPASMSIRLNLLSLVSGALSAGLVCLLVGYFVRCCFSHEDTLPLADSATRVAGLVAAFVFIFSTATWQASTHLEYRIFDVFLALCLFSLYVPMMRWPKFTAVITPLIGLGVGVCLVESVIFAPLMPVFLFLLVAAAVKSGRKFYVPVALYLLFFIVAYVVTTRIVSAAYLQLPEAAVNEFSSAGKVWDRCAAGYWHEMRLWFSRPGWLYVILFAVVPFAACAFAAGRGLNNERTWSQYLFHAAMTVCAILGMATPVSPEGQMRAFGILPVATTTLVAVVCGYLAAYWYVLWRTRLPVVEYDKLAVEITFGKRAAPVVGAVFAVILVLAAVLNVFACRRDRGRFADRCAEAILDRMGTRTWLVTDGLLDDHIRTVAATRGQEVNLVCLHRDEDKAYLKELQNLIAAKKLTSTRADLNLSVQLGVWPFLKDWLEGDADVAGKLAIFGVPDFWDLANCRPVPECLFFGGVKDLKAFDGRKAKADFETFWKQISEVLPGVERQGSRAMAKEEDSLVRLRLNLRRHIGFIANNLGVMLQDGGLNEEAFAIYELVLNDIDCDNVSSLFNEYEMAAGDVACAKPHLAAIKRKLQAVVDDPKRRYALFSLSRWYGYIRNPEIFVRLGFAWARSGQFGNAIAQFQRAIDFVPADRQSGILNMIASLYTSNNQLGKSREIYRKVLAQDSTNRDALMGLMQLSLQEGNVAEAKKYLTAVVKSSKSSETKTFDSALLHMMNNNLLGARLALQQVTDIQPKSLRAWSLLAGVLLQQYDEAKDDAGRQGAMKELEDVILPKMETLATSSRDYFVQLVRALVLLRKGPESLTAARDALLTASADNPSALMLGNMILDIDIRLNDGESAEKHARQVLRQDRENKLANYVMGSIRLKEEKYELAESYLRLSVKAAEPIAAAQNDLAEALHRLGRFAEAEKFARDAVKNVPELYVAWETLGSTLLDQNKNLDEAEQCVNKAIELSKKTGKLEDVRMLLTLARVQIARKDHGRARGTLRILRSRRDELSEYDIRELEKIEKSSQR